MGGLDSSGRGATVLSTGFVGGAARVVAGCGVGEVGAARAEVEATGLVGSS